MHPNASFRHDDPDFRSSLVREIGFAAIFLQTPDGPRVAHTPVHLTEAGTLRFHLARSNALTRHLDGATALAVVNGPDAYVSARWYESGNQVPTWNYVAFEFEGRVNPMDPAALPQLLETLSDHHEARVVNGIAWTMDKMEDKALSALLRGIVGFEMEVTTIRETVKLSQNKPAEERTRLIAGLEAQGEKAIAALMRRVSP